MPKFRTMQVGTPTVATHLLNNPDSYLTQIGSFLRGSSLDEASPVMEHSQGGYEFCGSAPTLLNQTDLITLRTQYGVHELLPGLTDWAQVNGWDELPIPAKVALDVEYLERQSLWFDIQIIFLTAMRVIRRDGVSH